MSSRPDHLQPSKLGTKEYWDNLYTTEISNHAADPSDTGTVWFDDSDAEAKILDFLARTFPPETLPRDDTSFLDLGCGNGSLLFSLRDDDDDDDEEEEIHHGPWTGRLLGVDYSPQSVALARQISSSREPDQSADISFDEWDILAGPWTTVLNGSQSAGWDVVLDKGTFDAISLSNVESGIHPCEKYRGRVLRLVREEGFFIVTSCNWTEKELRAWFEGGDEPEVGSGVFVLHGRVDYRTFSFGGATGQTITTLCFRRVNKSQS